MSPIPFFLTAAHPCSYLEEQRAQSVMADPDYQLSPSNYSRLIEHGFRRSGDVVYKPYCQYCQACVPVRIPVNLFQPDRKQRRCEKSNALTLAQIKPAAFDQGHFALYQRYQVARHEKQHVDQISREDYIDFLGSSWCDTWFVEFEISGTLAAVAVVDVLDHGLSAVYTFFDPQFSNYSPGVYAVLWQIGQARKMQLEYLYLGFWIKNCRKMSYKNQYSPLQGLIDQQWQIIPEHQSTTF